MTDFEKRAEDYEIEKGIKIPPKKSKHEYLYPFGKLKIGESFFVKGKTATELSINAFHAKLRNNHNYTLRTYKNGCRVWRIKL